MIRYIVIRMRHNLHEATFLKSHCLDFTSPLPPCLPIPHLLSAFSYYHFVFSPLTQRVWFVLSLTSSFGSERPGLYSIAFALTFEAQVTDINLYSYTTARFISPNYTILYVAVPEKHAVSMLDRLVATLQRSISLGKFTLHLLLDPCFQP